MADDKISNYTAQTASGLVLPDLLLTIDVSDTTMAASGTNKKIPIEDYIAGVRQQLVNQSTSNQGAGFSTDTYLTGSNVSFPSGYPVVGTYYRLVFNASKTSSGSAAPVITVRIGTAASTADTARLTFTFNSGTNVTDNGLFEVHVLFRTVGATTTAVVVGSAVVTNTLASTGLVGTTKAVTGQVSSGFDSTVASLKIGASYNGGSGASHTVHMVRAELIL